VLWLFVADIFESRQELSWRYGIIRGRAVTEILKRERRDDVIAHEWTDLDHRVSVTQYELTPVNVIQKIAGDGLPVPNFHLQHAKCRVIKACKAGGCHVDIFNGSIPSPL